MSYPKYEVLVVENRKMRLHNKRTVHTPLNNIFHQFKLVGSILYFNDKSINIRKIISEKVQVLLQITKFC